MTIQSATISGRLTIDMHSLNNEGGEGNQIQTRMVHIVDGAGELAVVNAISGDMFKHIQAEHFQAMASNGAHLPLCEGCRRFDANRVNADPGFFAALPDKAGGEEITDRLLSHCAMDDAEGILITAGNRSVGRKSTVEFGWAVGLPAKTRTESYFHVKYDPSGRGKGSGDETGANVGQNIFYRPASSGVYAVVVNMELWRVGWNDISRRQVVTGDDLTRRRRAVWDSVLHTFLKPNGAQRNTQHPHILGFDGIVSWSLSTVPAPAISALGDQYAEQTEGIAAALEKMHAGEVRAERVDSIAALAEKMAQLATDV
jgi:CRISPR-associated protein Cst2